jgi:hypothetical protein
MFANPLEVFPAYRGPKNSSNGDAPSRHPVVHPDRRTRVRTTVHWPIVVFRHGSSDAIESVTQNLSSSGFYCHCQTLIAPGEFLICAIKFPSYDPSGHERPRILECRVQVKRVEPEPAGDCFGIACHIQDYRLVVGEENSRILDADGV